MAAGGKCKYLLYVAHSVNNGPVKRLTLVASCHRSFIKHFRSRVSAQVEQLCLLAKPIYYICYDVASADALTNRRRRAANIVSVLKRRR